ncbi:hypothetical protein BKA81DRAFT_17411 [Phyllosticta paracitricarpa]
MQSLSASSIHSGGPLSTHQPRKTSTLGSINQGRKCHYPRAPSRHRSAHSLLTITVHTAGSVFSIHRSAFIIIFSSTFLDPLLPPSSAPLISPFIIIIIIGWWRSWGGASAFFLLARQSSAFFVQGLDLLFLPGILAIRIAFWLWRRSFELGCFVFLFFMRASLRASGRMTTLGN